MARRFVRVDLSDSARDFLPVAVEPGVPLLDGAGTNAKILFRWLGDLAADPELEGDSVNFHVLDAEGGRLEDVVCQPASEEDLAGILGGDWELLQQRIDDVKPETATERALLETLREAFRKQLSDQARFDRSHYFFEYRDVLGRWRLVWCWGFRRRDQQPARTSVCGNPACKLLFVRRAGSRAKCPDCQAVPQAAPVGRKPRKGGLLVRLLLLLVAAVLLNWFVNRSRLVATPEEWVGPAGSQVEFEILRPGPFGFGNRDVSRQVEATTEDPSLVRFGKPTARVTALAAGTTAVRFRLGRRSIRVKMTVLPAARPERIAVEPQPVEPEQAPPPGEDMPGEDRPDEDRPDEDMPGEHRPGEHRPDEDMPVEDRPVEDRPVEDRPVEERPVEERPVEERPVKDMPVDNRSVEDRPVEVRIASDQGPAVEVPVGAEFDDFRIEAVYQDGFTRTVTNQATMRMADGILRGPVSFSEGRILAIRPGRTVVEADFQGVRTKKGLGVTVTARVDLDEIRLLPDPLRILPGETVTFEAMGYRGGRSVGVLTGLGTVEWSSGDQRVARMAGPTVTGIEIGSTEVTAQLGPVASKPAEVSVVASIADELVVDQKTLWMRVGETRRMGVDLTVLRAGVDFSRQVRVTPDLPQVVRYFGPSHSLLGVSPGVSAVRFAWGNKLAEATVHVLPAGTYQGEVLVEPGTAGLSPGQAIPLRAFLRTDEGVRLDRSESAIFTSSSPASVSIQGNLACAVSPGEAEITATLPEARQPGHAYVAVDNQPIVELTVEPAGLAMSVGDQVRLRILGRSASGTHLLFPQTDLRVTAAGADPGCIHIVGSQEIAAGEPGHAEVSIDWQGRLNRLVPVAVTLDSRTDLANDPRQTTIDGGSDVLIAPGATEPHPQIVPDVLRMGSDSPAASAEVAVKGDRFMEVRTLLESGRNDFSVAIEVLAAKSAGPLEYRVFESGGSPPEVWVPCEAFEDGQRVRLTSPAIRYRDRLARYNLTIEARRVGGDSPQQYPFTFRLESRIVEDAQPNNH